MNFYTSIMLKNNLSLIFLLENIVSEKLINMLIWCAIFSIPTFLVLLHIRNNKLKIKKITRWRQSYLFKHWFGTLLISSTLYSLFLYLSEKNHDIFGDIMFHFVFSFLFSLPTLIFYLLFFVILSQLNFSVITTKAILITIAIMGALISNYIIWGFVSILMELFYIVTILVTGVFFKLEKTKAK